MSEFLYMNGYGLYVFGSYGICAVLLLALTLASLRASRTLKGALEKEKQK